MRTPFQPRFLPPEAARLCHVLSAPPPLVAHLTVVHDAATRLLDGLAKRFQPLSLDRAAIEFGAATHDLGKTLHLHELTGPGLDHERDGPDLLVRHGVPARLARFARSHGRWHDAELPLEDALVALADTIWKGARGSKLEARVIELIAAASGEASWAVFTGLDDILEPICAEGDARLAWQAAYSGPSR